jgi:thiol-disulfide isomerase/thioredoxin
MGNARRNVLVAGVAAAAAAAGAGVAWWRRGPAPTASAAAQPGDTDALAALWALRLDRPEGGELVLAELRGKPLLINFWATWCPPCVKEMPELDRFHRAFSPQGWQVVGLAIDGPTAVREFLTRVKVGFPIGMAGLGGTELVRSLGNPRGGLPFSVLIGASGQVLQRKLGETHFDELAGWARQA